MNDREIIKKEVEEENTSSSQSASDNREDAQEKEDEASTPESDLTTFGASKHFYGALTWLVCVILMFACFLETKIWAMALLMPVLLIISAGFFRDAKFTSVDFEDLKMTIKDYSSFAGIKNIINIKDIKLVEMEAEEKKDEIIHSLILVTNDGNFEIPDIDNKAGLLDKIKSLNPKVQVKRV
ncbi:MAG: hypothetical protein K8T10_01855 [Candidatus Eremiobacteraeota bacterium]|nr:hypothetical protein [Candidatus Eremiobacteraeota bacterium]